MHIGPVPVRLIDVIDILLVAFLMYQIYNLIKGSIAIYIFITVVAFYVLWLLVKENFLLLGSLFSQIISVGFIAIIILFQQEIRRFLVLISTRYLSRTGISLENFFSDVAEADKNLPINFIVKACINMAKNHIGALIVLKRKSPLDDFIKTGDLINADISSRLIESIFNKTSPLHDGAVIIIDDKLRAARCVLPVSDNFELPANYGLRHRAAVGLTEETDALVIVISEETGDLSLAEAGRIKKTDTNVLYKILEKEFLSRKY
jgi:diadenylate cyclase